MNAPAAPAAPAAPDGGETELTVLSLFAGIGGLELGLERAGMRVVGQVEINPFCRSVLARHWPEVPRHDDVRTVPAWWAARPRPVVDVVAGGFPCQPFSTAGRRRGVADERWGWPWMADVVRLVRPRYVLVENVAALLADRQAFGWVLADLATLGFDARWGVLSACALGAPHTRERLFLLAHPTASMGDRGWGLGRGGRYRADTENRIRGLIASTGSWRPTPRAVEWLMGFPPDWTDPGSPDSATPSSPRSPSTSATTSPATPPPIPDTDTTSGAPRSA